MSYADLLRALSDEAEREARAIADGGARDAERVLEEARREAARRREEALAAADSSLRDGSERARAAAAREVEAAGLREAARQLEALREAALDALRARGATLLPALVDELAALAAPGLPAAFVVDPGEEQRVREHLARAHPALAAAASVRAAPRPRGGVELEQDGVVLDDTLPSRLSRAWAALEPRLAATLLGEADERR